MWADSVAGKRAGTALVWVLLIRILSAALLVGILTLRPDNHGLVLPAVAVGGEEQEQDQQQQDHEQDDAQHAVLLHQLSEAPYPTFRGGGGCRCCRCRWNGRRCRHSERWRS